MLSMNCLPDPKPKLTMDERAKKKKELDLKRKIDKLRDAVDRKKNKEKKIEISK